MACDITWLSRWYGFQKLCFRDGLMSMVGLTAEIKLRYQILQRSEDGAMVCNELKYLDLILYIVKDSS